MWVSSLRTNVESMGSLEGGCRGVVPMRPLNFLPSSDIFAGLLRYGEVGIELMVDAVVTGVGK